MSTDINQRLKWFGFNTLCLFDFIHRLYKGLMAAQLKYLRSFIKYNPTKVVFAWLSYGHGPYTFSAEKRMFKSSSLSDDTFPDHGLRGEPLWAEKSSDITLLDGFLLGYVKERLDPCQ